MPAAARRFHTSQSSRRHVVEEAARRRDRLAGDAVQVLEPDRDPGQHRRRAVAPHAGRAQPLVRPGGGRDRVLLVDAHPGVDRAGIALVAVHAVAPRGSAPAARR